MPQRRLPWEEHRETLLGAARPLPPSCCLSCELGAQVLLGVPGGSICVKQHIPDYLGQVSQLKSRGVHQVYVVTGDSQDAAAGWAKEAGIDGDKIKASSLTRCMDKRCSAHPHSPALTRPGPVFLCRSQVLSDTRGYFTRLMGMDIAQPQGASGPRSQRYSAYVEDGTLLKVLVERQPADYKLSNSATMVDFIDTVVLKKGGK